MVGPGLDRGRDQPCADMFASAPLMGSKPTPTTPRKRSMATLAGSKPRRLCRAMVCDCWGTVGTVAALIGGGVVGEGTNVSEKL